VLTVLYLVRARAEKRERLGGWTGRLPSSTRLDALAYRLNAFAFPLWTFTVVRGAIWAENAWGRSWNWDPKEVWAFITWVVYAGYLPRAGDGRLAAQLRGLDRPGRVQHVPVQLPDRQHLLPRPALVRRGCRNDCFRQDREGGSSGDGSGEGSASRRRSERPGRQSSQHLSER
jgi:hypothetical protein